MKRIVFNDEAKSKMIMGLNKLADAVKITLGPKGRNVAIERSYGSPKITKDGVTVAKSIDLEDKIENMGAQLLKEVASKTGEIAGDGTTTATVLAQAISLEGFKMISSGYSPISIKRGLDKALEMVISELNKMSIKVTISEEIKNVATISANNDPEIGKIIAEAMDKVGKEGVITVEEAKGMETYLETVEGMQFDRGYLSPYFITNAEKMQVIMENPFILVYDRKILSLKNLIPILEQVAQQSRPLLIIAEDIESEILATLVANKVRGILNLAVIKSPGFGDRQRPMLEDICILTGAKLISEDAGDKLEDTTIDKLGTAKKIKIDKENTTIINGNGDSEKIKDRINQLKSQISECSVNFEKERLQDRLAKISGGVAIIHVGAATEVEMREKKDRVEDAIQATKAAVEEGIIEGGGVALLKCRDSLLTIIMDNEDENIAGEILYRALSAPIRQIVLNAGEDVGVVINKILSSESIGFDASKSEYVNMFEKGIIDPTKVTKTALINAVSVASTLLTTEVIIYDIPEKNIPNLPNFNG